MIIKIPQHLIHVSTLPCKTQMSENKRHSQTNVMINDKSKGSVTTRLSCGKILKSHFENLFAESASEKTF